MALWRCYKYATSIRIYSIIYYQILVYVLNELDPELSISIIILEQSFIPTLV